MEVTLENNYYAFSAREDTRAVITVTSGALDYSGQTSGLFRAAGSIAQGDTHEFTQPTIVAAHERTVFEIEYPSPVASQLPAPVPSLEPQPEVEPEQDVEGSGTP